MRRDILGLAPEFDGAFDLVYDYTCFCALPPHLRGAYARVLEAILKPEGFFLILAFPMMSRRPPREGPPFRVLETDLVKTFSPAFKPLENFDAVGSSPQRAGYERWYVWQRRS